MNNNRLIEIVREGNLRFFKRPETRTLILDTPQEIAFVGNHPWGQTLVPTILGTYLTGKKISGAKYDLESNSLTGSGRALNKWEDLLVDSGFIKNP